METDRGGELSTTTQGTRENSHDKIRLDCMYMYVFEVGREGGKEERENV